MKNRCPGLVLQGTNCCNMKRNLLFVICLISLSAMGQSQPQPAYLRYPTLPPMEVMQPDSVVFTKADLKKQPTLIMFFSPDCDHCIHQMEDMAKRKQDLSKLQIIMVTHQPMDMLKAFIEKYKIKTYPNIRIGRDTKFILPGFYQMKGLPYFALYTSKGDLITTFESNVAVDKLLAAYKKK